MSPQKKDRFDREEQLTANPEIRQARALEYIAQYLDLIEGCAFHGS
jgi:hypothetical protein